MKKFSNIDLDCDPGFRIWGKHLKQNCSSGKKEHLLQSFIVIGLVEVFLNIF